MSISDKLQTIAENEPKVYNAGKIALLKDSKYMNATEVGNVITINNLSSIEHDFKVSVDYNLLTAPYTTTATGDGTVTGLKITVKEASISLSGTSNSYSFATDIVQFNKGVASTLTHGTKYYAGIKYVTGDVNRYPINLYFMCSGGLNPIFNVSEIVWDSSNTENYLVIGFVNGVDYTGCEFVPILSPVVSIKRYGKNLCPKSSITTAEQLHGQIDIKKVDFGIIPQGTYTASFDITRYADDDVTNPRLSMFFYYTDGTNENVTLYTNDVPNDGVTRKYILTKTSNSVKEIDYIRLRPFQFSAPYTTRNAKAENIQVEYNDIPTVYEPYVEPQTLQAKADGTVEGIETLPNMTLIPDNQNVILECQYLRDIDTFIDDLMISIALTGGE